MRSIKSILAGLGILLLAPHGVEADFRVTSPITFGSGFQINTTTGVVSSTPSASSYGYYYVPNAAGNGTTDDSAAIQAVIDSVPATGGTVLLDGTKKYRLNSSLTFGPNITFDCGVSPGGVAPQIPTIGDTYQLNSMGGLRLDGTATLEVGPSTHIQNCFMTRFGATWPTNNPSGYAGTAITFPSAISDDVVIENVLMVGFQSCVDQAFQADRFHLRHLECDAVTGFRIGPSKDSSEILMVRNWPWGTAFSGSPTNARTGTGFLFTGTDRDDDIKINNISDFGHAIGLEQADPGGNCCNIYADNVWLDNNGTTGLSAVSSIGFGRVWIFSSGGVGVLFTSGGNSTISFSSLLISGATDCVSLVGGPSISSAHTEVGGCTSSVVRTDNVGSHIDLPNLLVNDAAIPTPYINLSVGLPSTYLNLPAPRLPFATSIADLLGTGAITPLAADGDIVAPTTGIPAATRVIAGAGQQTPALTDSGAHGGMILLKATGNAAGDGGGALFGQNSGHDRYFAAIKGSAVSGSNATAGDLDFSTRFVDTDAALTKNLHIDHTGYVQVAKTVLGGNLQTCNAGTLGAYQVVSDSNTTTWGDTVTGGGAPGTNVMAWCNGTNWTVMGK